MLFNIEQDLGDKVIGYLVPDAFAGVGSVRVSGGGKVIAVFSPPEQREALVQAGRHETGLCGFTIDETMIPGLAGMVDLEIHDHDSGCMIYRRHQDGMVKAKVFRFETHLFPLWRLDDRLGGRFQYYAKGVERFGRETATQIFLMNEVDSFYASGRLNYKNFTYYLENGFDCCTIIQSPHQEFAERLLVLRHIRQMGMQYLGDRDAQRLVPAITFAETMPLDDEKALRRFFLEMPHEVAVLMANPVVRQFTTNNPDDMPNNTGVVSALDILSTFKIVGIRDKAEDFVHGLEEWFGLPDHDLPMPPAVPAAKSLGDFLERSGVVDVLIEKDGELYQHVLDARRGVEDAGSGRPIIIDGKTATI